ncbi:hypothetical protein [Pseudonocardia hierapolitana]|nr:hypothetical protein [Pseudonocardia hierapolitana]
MMLEVDQTDAGGAPSAGVHPHATAVCFPSAVNVSKQALRGAGLAAVAPGR